VGDAPPHTTDTESDAVLLLLLRPPHRPAPHPQPFPHTSFEHEASFLRSHFGHLGNGGSAYVLGDMFNGLQWHVYVVDAAGEGCGWNGCVCGGEKEKQWP
jgi:hypothetical protein